MIFKRFGRVRGRTMVCWC